MKLAKKYQDIENNPPKFVGLLGEVRTKPGIFFEWVSLFSRKMGDSFYWWGFREFYDSLTFM